MDLTKQDIQVILDVLDTVSVPVKQGREVVEPIRAKLQIMAMKMQETPVAPEAPATPEVIEGQPTN